MDITRVTESEFEETPGAIGEKALREPVAITKEGRDLLVLLSAEEYARLIRRGRKVFTLDDLPDEWLDAVEKSEMPAGLEHLDAELR